MGANQAMRTTWLKDAVSLGMDYRFFHGHGESSREDVVLVDCNDAYYDLTSKTKEKLKWALSNGYGHIFCCFPDTYACAERLLNCGYKNHHYMGAVFCHPEGNPYCQGGPGYFLSKEAAEIVAYDSRNYPNEDCFVGDLMKRSGVVPMHSPEFRYMGTGPLKANSVISSHLSAQPGGYTVQAMLREHEAWRNS